MHNGVTSIDEHFPTNNYPLRQGKGTVYEGGIRVPCVIKVPDVTLASSTCSENIHAVDFFPTLLDYAGVTAPSEKFKQIGQVLDGISIMPLLRGEQKALNRAGVFTNFIHNVPATGNISAAAINSGKWKLIINYESLGGLKEKYELYDLEENISETRNLAALYPDKVAELEGYIIQHQNAIPQAKPKLNPLYSEETLIPAAYRRWDKWVKEFAKKVENDFNIKGNFPKVIISNEITDFYEKTKNSLIMKIDKPSTIAYKYDDKIAYENKPKMIDGIAYIPLKYVAEKFGFSYVQDPDTVTLSINNIAITLGENIALVDGENAAFKNKVVQINNEFMLSLDAMQTIFGKTASFDESGLILIDDYPVCLTNDEIAIANRLIDSFAAYTNAYWNAHNTITMVKQAEMEDEFESIK